MKSAIIVSLLAVVSAAKPHGSRSILQPWKETNWHKLTEKPFLKMHELDEDALGTYLYCKTFDSANPAKGPYKTYQECIDDHHKRAWLKPDPTSQPPCHKDTGYPEEACGTQVYCKQYDVEGDQPFPAIYDSSTDCFSFHAPPN